AIEVFPEFEPPTWIDSATGTVGCFDSTQPLPLVRRYWRGPAITPEQVSATREQIARATGGGDFPRPRALPVEQQPLASLSARLILSSGPKATLCFNYNGLPVNSDRLQDEQAAVRQMMNGILYEIPRDHDVERRLRARLADALPEPTQGREAWLKFMMTSVPALEAERWDVRVEDDFPYRLAKADDWFGDLATDPRQGWFNLRLGVVVAGQQVNLLPALARYLQTSLAGGQTALPSEPTPTPDLQSAAAPDAG